MKKIKEITAREHEVAKLVAEGLTNAKIAKKLKITEGTVKQHLYKIFSKLKVKSRLQLVTKFKI